MTSPPPARGNDAEYYHPARRVDHFDRTATTQVEDLYRRLIVLDEVEYLFEVIPPELQEPVERPIEQLRAKPEQARR